MTFPHFKIVAACVLWCVAFSHADTVTLVSGKTLTGKITFDGKSALTITPKSDPPIKADLRDVVALKTDLAKPAVPARLATLIDGTRIAATQVLSLDDRELRLKRPDGGILSVNTALVSSIDFAPGQPHAPVAGGFVGAQIGEKDTAEGDVLSISPTTVKISSVLFGVQEFDTAKAVRGVCLRPTGISKAAYVVQAADGSTWQATALTSEAGKANLATDLAGPIALAPTDITTLDLGPASADDLTTLTANATGTLQLAAGQQQNLNVAGKYRAVVLNYRIPDYYMPTRSAKLVVLADDKEIAKSEAITSLDNSITLTRSLDGVKQLTLKLEATGPAQLGIIGEIESARLIRAN